MRCVSEQRKKAVSFFTSDRSAQTHLDWLLGDLREGVFVVIGFDTANIVRRRSV